AYGPLGEVRQFNTTYHVLSELLPARQFEYGLSAGQCTTPTCRATGNVDLHYGVTDRWTVRAGVEQFWRDGVPNRTHPYVATVVNPSNAWALSLEAVGGASAAAGVQFEPSLNVRLAAGYTAYAGDAAPVLFGSGRRSAACWDRCGCAPTSNSNSAARCRPPSWLPRGRSGPGFAWRSASDGSKARRVRRSRCRCRATSRRCAR